MTSYILLLSLTSECRKKFREKPERIREVNKETEAFGAKVLQQYAVLDRSDFNMIFQPSLKNRSFLLRLFNDFS